MNYPGKLKQMEAYKDCIKNGFSPNKIVLGLLSGEFDYDINKWTHL